MARLKYYNTKTNAWETVDSTFGTGDVKTVNGVEPDANGNIEIGIPEMPEINYPVTSVNGMTGDVVIEVGSEQVQSNLSQNDPEAPDYVKGRTHYEESNQTVIEWDGNTEGREMLALTGDYEGAVCYKVHNNTPTQDELFGGVLGVDTGNGVDEVAITEDVFESTAGFNAVNCLFIGPLMIAYSTEISLLGETYTLQSTGIFAATYFRKLTYGSTVVHQLDEKFIPDSVARKTDVTWENLPDKPFYEDPSKRETIIEPAEYKVNGASAHGVVKHVNFGTGPKNLEEGKVYTIIIDGEEYVVTAKRTEYDDSTYSVYIGNHDVVSNEEVGWCYACTFSDLWDGNCVFYVYREGEWGSVNLALYEGVSDYYPIKEKFLPKAAAVPDAAGEAPTAAEFNALLAALRSAGYLAT